MSKLHTKSNWGKPKNKNHLDLARKSLAMQYNNKDVRRRILSGVMDGQYEIQAILYALANQK